MIMLLDFILHAILYFFAGCAVLGFIAAAWFFLYVIIIKVILIDMWRAVLGGKPKYIIAQTFFSKED